MGLFDMYSDAMQRVAETMQRADPFGPIGAAGEVVAGLFGTVDLVSNHGVDAMWNRRADLGEVASIAQGMLPLAKQTLIIAGGLKTVLAMQYQCGFTSTPEDGDGYSQSAQRFNTVADRLGSAFPDERWQGDAAEAYSEENRKQEDRARRMPGVDLDVLMAISSEAGAVQTTRRILDNAATLMGNAIAPALAARAIPGRAGTAISREIEIAAVGVSLPTCIWYMNRLTEHAEHSARTMAAAARAYDAIADECYPDKM